MHNKKYRGSEIFNHDVFYSWCLSVKKEGHIVYVSERNKLPKPFKKVWSKDKRIAIKNNENHKTHNEKLFKLSEKTEMEKKQLHEKIANKLIVFENNLKNKPFSKINIFLFNITLMTIAAIVFPFTLCLLLITIVITDISIWLSLIHI